MLEKQKALGWADGVSLARLRGELRTVKNQRLCRVKMVERAKERITGGTKYQRGAGSRVSARSEPQAKDHPGGTLGRDPRWTRGTNSDRSNR